MLYSSHKSSIKVDYFNKLLRMLFIEVTKMDSGGYFATCPKLSLQTEASDLAELHGTIMQNIQDCFDDADRPALKDVHLLVSQE